MDWNDTFYRVFSFLKSINYYALYICFIKHRVLIEYRDM